MSSICYCRATARLGAACLIFSAISGQAQITLPPAQSPSPVTTLEYFIDSDPGVGNGTALPVTASTDVSITTSIPLTGISPGIHRVYFRGQAANGIWGLTNMRILYVAPGFSFSTAAPADVTALEYFFDTDPGIGLATAVPLTPGPDVTDTQNINTSSLSNGVHYLGVRVKDLNGDWGLTNVRPVYVIPSLSLPTYAVPSPIVRAEYFVDNDPGTGLGTAIPVTSDTAVYIPGFVASIGMLGNGVHNIGVRFQDASGNWSLTSSSKLSVIVANIDLPPAAPAQAFSELEYFFDTDPGMGNGTLLSFPATTDLNSFNFVADISTLSSGPHILYVRSTNPWSITTSQTFTIDFPLPLKLLQFNAHKRSTDVQLTWETTDREASETFVIERSKDGRQFDSLGMVRTHIGSAGHYTYTDRQPIYGEGYYRLKQIDAQGKATYSHIVSVRFNDMTQPLFSCNNPVQEELRIFRNGAIQEQAIYIISNLQGQDIVHFSGNGNAVETHNVSQLPQGTYLLRASVGTETETIRFQKY